MDLVIALIVVAILGLAATTAGCWLGFTYGYRRGTDDCENAHLDARDAYYDILDSVSRR